MARVARGAPSSCGFLIRGWGIREGHARTEPTWGEGAMSQGVWAPPPQPRPPPPCQRRPDFPETARPTHKERAASGLRRAQPLVWGTASRDAQSLAAQNGDETGTGGGGGGTRLPRPPLAHGRRRICVNLDAGLRLGPPLTRRVAGERGPPPRARSPLEAVGLRVRAGRARGHRCRERLASHILGRPGPAWASTRPLPSRP